ncbi:MAG: hypothetical protein ACR2P7_04305 [bacterium]
MSAPAPRTRQYTRTALLQMLAVFLLLCAVVAWQWDVLRQVYFHNQLNALGWAINGSILLLFFCGLAALLARLFQYRAEEIGVARLLDNLAHDREPLLEVAPDCFAATRYRIVRDLSARRADINHNALAATLLAAESSRNSFPKFVHNVLILTGVFGTIISLSLSLLGAADMIHAGAGAAPAAGQSNGETDGLGSMIFGMSTALSTTMTAILAYLVFGYFYIKLTDAQTYLLSQIEEATATALLPHLQPRAAADAVDYAQSLRGLSELIERLGTSQQQNEGAVQALLDASQALSARSGGDEIAAALARLGAAQEQSAAEQRAQLSALLQVLQEGFRLRR